MRIDWRAAFTEKWAYKVAALLLAVLLWFNLTAGERRDQAVRTAVEFVWADSAWAAVELPREVNAVFQGRRSDISRLFLDSPRIRYVLDEITSPVMRVTLDPEMIAYDRELSVRPIDVRPSEVELRFERIISRTLPVEAPIQGSAAPGYIVIGETQLEPGSVTVRGIESEVNAMGAIRTERLSLRNLTRSESHLLALELPSEFASLTVDPPGVLATLDVDSLVERTFDVTVRQVGAAAGSVRLVPQRVTVQVRGAARMLENLTFAGIAASITVEEMPAGPRDFAVRIVLPEGTAATAIVVPPVVSAVPARSDEALPEAGSETG